MQLKEMRAVGYDQGLPIEHERALLDLVVPIPRPLAHDVLVRVEAIAVNPADCRMRRRKVDDGLFAVGGWDAAGTVVDKGYAVGPEFAIGDAVYYAGALERAGSNAEYQLVDARLVGHRPKTMTATQAAALPLTALTVWEALFERMTFSLTGPNTQRHLLIVGGAGGVGSMAIQLAKRMPDVCVIATASRSASQAWCRRLGADEVIDHHGDMAQQLADLGVTEVSTILLTQQPDQHFLTLAALLAPQGKLCNIVPFAQPPDVNVLLQKSATLVWAFMFTRSLFQIADQHRQGQILQQVADWVDAGLLASTASQDLGPINAANLRRAHAQIESTTTIGKLTLTGF